jgi:hypothetical protein
MVVSSSSASLAPSVKLLSGKVTSTAEAFEPSKPSLVKLNETATFVSERVHVGEIAVIRDVARLPGRSRAFRRIACRSPVAPI